VLLEVGDLVKLIEEILVKFSQLVIDFPEIKEIDINPLILHKDCATAVDARIVLDFTCSIQDIGLHENLVIAPYPQKYVLNFRSKNGVLVHIRPIKPEDELRFNDLFKQCYRCLYSFISGHSHSSKR
jgi:acetyltransferase